ncbi:g2335 [Coccomyxa elongata]
MVDPPPSPSGTSTAVPASPLRTQRGQRLERGPSGALLLQIHSPSTVQQPARGPSSRKCLLLQACFLLLLLASGALLFTQSMRTAWVSNLLQKQSSTSTSRAPASQVVRFAGLIGMPEPLLPVMQPHIHKRDIRPRTEKQDKLDSEAFLRGPHKLDWRPDLNRGKDRGTIPKILHHIFLDGEAEYNKEVEAAKAVGSGFRREWRDSCIKNHSDWKYMFWDKAAAVTFLQTHYPWYLSTFLSYPKVVLQGDALRPFLLHAFGGLYLDLDVQCFRPSDPWLAGADLVLQSEYKEQRDIVNSIMASVPGHPFWKLIIGRMLSKMEGARGKVDSDVVLESTGPRLYGSVFQQFAPQAEPLGTSFVGKWQVDGSSVWVWGLGSWFVPCEWNNQPCHVAFAQAVQEGRVPEPLAGYHQYSGSWLRAMKTGGR